MQIRRARLFFAIFFLRFWDIGPTDLKNQSIFTLILQCSNGYKIKEEIELSIRSIGPMPQIRQKKWRKISEQALNG